MRLLVFWLLHELADESRTTAIPASAGMAALNEAKA
jgi:hypothetical protein